MFTVGSLHLEALCKKLMDGHVRYSMKTPRVPLGTAPEDVRFIDCSGFVHT